MARKNRVSVYDGIYHVTTRIANRAMLLAEEGVKNEILGRIVSVARFSGVELWAFCIMDNHLHLFVRVPSVPKEYWLDPNDEPAAYAFGMRPPEIREPLWSPAGDSPRDQQSHDGDSPQRRRGEERRREGRGRRLHWLQSREGEARRLAFGLEVEQLRAGSRRQG